MTLVSETQRRARALFSRKARAKQECKGEWPPLNREGEAEKEAEREAEPEAAKLQAFFDGGELGEVRKKNGREKDGASLWAPKRSQISSKLKEKM